MAVAIFFPAVAGGAFPLALVVVVIAYLRSVYSTSGMNTALFMFLMFLMVPTVLYILFRVVNSGTPASGVVLKLLPLIIIIFLTLVVVGWFYVMKNIRAGPVKDRARTDRRSILRDAQAHFGFLLEKGYQISHLDNVDHPYGGWHLQIDSPGDTASIVLDEQLKPLLAVSIEQTDRRCQILLDAMIYHLTGKDVSKDHLNSYFPPGRRQRFENTAILLRTYLDPIENYLRDHPEITENELNDIQTRYVDLIDQEDEQRNKI